MSHTHEAWISNNKGWMNLVRRTRWHISGLQGLDYQHSYLITSNHQSWVDIWCCNTCSTAGSSR